MMAGRIITDRGPEFLNSNMKEVVDTLGITVEYEPSHRPDLKAVVERMIGKVQDEFRGFIEGEVSDDIRKKANKFDYRMNAALTLYEYTQLIIKAVIHHNNDHVLSQYQRTEDMIINNVNPIPLSLWQYSNENLLGYNCIDTNYVNLCVMPREAGTVTAQGIKFKGMLYGCERGIKEQWFVKARNKGNYSVQVSYDPRNTNQIYVHTDNLSYEIANLLEHQDVFRNKTYEEIAIMLKSERNLITNLKEEHLAKKVKFVADVQRIGNVQAAKTGESKASKLRDIKVNKEAEIIKGSNGTIIKVQQPASNEEFIRNDGVEEIFSDEENEVEYESALDKFMKTRIPVSKQISK